MSGLPPVEMMCCVMEDGQVALKTSRESLSALSPLAMAVGQVLRPAQMCRSPGQGARPWWSAERMLIWFVRDLTAFDVFCRMVLARLLASAVWVD